ncbi:MAG: class I SAM-dependent methyltransferase [Euzebyales bacterium]|nr:class I SAM-dependent methyltransferase [Euzebyales bacterium]
MDPSHDAGAAAPDGSPVEFYRRLHPGRDADLLHDRIPERAAVLEFGCGTGRTTRALLERGHAVVAVDESAEMLAHVPADAEKVRACIEDLDLGRRFAGVLLASHLINIRDETRRGALLASCAGHVETEGAVMVQRFDPALAATATDGVSYDDGEIRIGMRGVRREGRDFSAVAVFEAGDRRWEQPYEIRILDDAAIEAELAAAGLRVREWIDGAWFAATPTDE